MEIKSDAKIIHARNRKAWRSWLQKNHRKEENVWLIIYHQRSKTPSAYYAEAVEEALCFGWIDSIKKKRDHESFFQFFSHRKPKSNWSKLNRERVAKLSEQGLMTAAGQAMVDLAKKTGTWTALANVENTVIPPDLKRAFGESAKARTNFLAFPVSSRQIILGWIGAAKRPETRQQRIQQTVALAKKNIRANHFRPEKPSRGK